MLRAEENDLIHATTPEYAVMMLGARPAFDMMFLDHDAGEGSGCATFYSVAEHIVAHKVPIGRVWIHSWNSYGAERMRVLLTEAGYEVTVRPFR